MILIIDNYDSFTYNLVQAFGEISGKKIKVFRNDKISVNGIKKLNPDYLIISPGPCTPNEAGVSSKAIKAFGGKIPILGVCLGHQCIGKAFGGKIVRDKIPFHGKTSKIFHDGKTIFRKIKNPFAATRYHSLIVEKESLPNCLEISAETENGTIMGLRHKIFQIEGVQFHPESFLTIDGKKLLKNFLKY